MIYVKTSRNFRIIMAIVIAIIVFSVVFQFLRSGRPVLSAIDEYGCLTPAGYAWNKYVGACIRGFELSKTQRAVAKIAIENMGQSKGLSVTTVEKEECTGCFTVKTVVAGTNNIKIVNVENWAVTNS